jgi:hypothetical protein
MDQIENQLMSLEVLVQELYNLMIDLLNRIDMWRSTPLQPPLYFAEFWYPYLRTERYLDLLLIFIEFQLTFIQRITLDIERRLGNPEPPQ